MAPEDQHPRGPGIQPRLGRSCGGAGKAGAFHHHVDARQVQERKVCNLR